MSSAQPQPVLTLNQQYTRDLSFEVPGAPEIFLAPPTQPQVAVNLDVQARRLREGEPVFEVTLTVKVEAGEKVEGGERKLFILELLYAGVFTLGQLPPHQVEPVLLVECPRLLFPFARNIVADVSRDGGFPPVMLQPVDFVALWQSQRQGAANGTQPTLN